MAQGALKISDFLTRSQFHRLALYNEFFRPLGVEYQIAVSLPPSPHLLIGIALNRGRQDFGARDRLMLNLLRPQSRRGPSKCRGCHSEEASAPLKDDGDLDYGIVILEPRGMRPTGEQTSTGNVP